MSNLISLLSAVVHVLETMIRSGGDDHARPGRHHTRTARRDERRGKRRRGRGRARPADVVTLGLVAIAALAILAIVAAIAIAARRDRSGARSCRAHAKPARRGSLRGIASVLGIGGVFVRPPMRASTAEALPVGS
jgi:hypothetical protein